jgi:hypothetical protein
MSITSRTGRKAGILGSVILAMTFLGVSPAFAATAVEEPPSYIGTPALSVDFECPCEENNNTGIATITFAIEEIGVGDPVEGHFVVNGASYDSFAFEGNAGYQNFTRTIEVDVPSLPTSLNVSYVINGAIVSNDGVSASQTVQVGEDCEVTEPTDPPTEPSDPPTEPSDPPVEVPAPPVKDVGHYDTGDTFIKDEADTFGLALGTGLTFVAIVALAVAGVTVVRRRRTQSTKG